MAKRWLKKISSEIHLSSIDSSTKVSFTKDSIEHEVSELEFGMVFIKVIAQVSPLLGLLGTVLGILSTFQVIASKGTSNPSLFAEGISLSLITTVGGLIVAIPHFIGHNFLSRLLDNIQFKLEKIVLKQLTNK